MPNIVGYGNTQIPTNAMLGDLAYQDSIGEIQLDQINSRIEKSATCIFIYDTTQDSDGGEWRKECSTQSWFIEAPNTHRGPRKDFPSLAVIVGTSNPSEITIYDGDDPNLPMFIRFSENNSLLYNDPTCVSAANGCIYFGQSTYGLGRYNFIGDSIGRYRAASTYRGYKGGDRSIGGRISVAPNGNHDGPPFNVGNLQHDDVKDVHTAITEGATVDESTGLPYPYIVVRAHSGHTGGINVIQNDGYGMTGSNHGYASSLQIGVIPDQEAFVAHHNGASSGQTIDVISLRDQYRLKGVNPDDFAQLGTFTTSTSNVHQERATGSGQRVEPVHATNAAGNGVGRYYGYGAVPNRGPFKWDSWGTSCNNLLLKDESLLVGTTNKGIIRIHERHENLQGSMRLWQNANVCSGWMHGNIIGAFAGNATGQTGTNSSTIGDLSQHGNDAHITGTLSYAPVADGADLMRWYGFNGSNYAKADASFNLGNGAALCMMGWFKTTITGSVQYLCSVNASGGGAAGLAIYNSGADGVAYFWDSVNSNTGCIGYGYTGLYDGQWHYLCGTMSYGSSATQKRLYVDGVLVAQTNKAVVNLNNCNKQNVGHYSSNGTDTNYRMAEGDSNGGVALVRFSGGDGNAANNSRTIEVPTAAQVKKIFNDERKLFYPNAKCTLYGSSSSCVAQDFDDSTGTYYVGTSQGRSDFRGLTRINNTTTAVTTDIAARKGLVVEQ